MKLSSKDELPTHGKEGGRTGKRRKEGEGGRRRRRKKEEEEEGGGGRRRRRKKEEEEERGGGRRRRRKKEEEEEGGGGRRAGRSGRDGSSTHGILSRESRMDCWKRSLRVRRCWMVCPILILTSSCSKAWSLDTSYGSLLERKEEREGVEGRRRERERRGGGGGGGGKREMKAKGEEHSANEGREQLILTVGEEERRKEGRGGEGRVGVWGERRKGSNLYI